MIDNHFRKHLPSATGSLISFYKLIRVTPNQLSVIAFLLSCIAAYLISVNEFVPALVTWWFGRLLDGTDGIYARGTGQATQFGAFLDILCDMASYSIMIFGFALAFPELQFYWLLILFLYVLCITGALALGSFESKKPELEETVKKDNRGLRLAAGVAEGGETGIAYTAFLLFPGYISLLAKVWIGVLIVTVLARTALAKKEL